MKTEIYKRNIIKFKLWTNAMNDGMKYVTIPLEYQIQRKLGFNYVAQLQLDTIINDLRRKRLMKL